MTGFVLSWFAIVLSVAGSQSTGLTSSKFDRSCGTLHHIDRIAIKGDQEFTQERERALGKVVLMLFPRQSGSNCCDGKAPVARATVGHSGAFDFKSVPPGFYWLVARVDGRDYKMAVQYGAGEQSDSRCPDFAYGSLPNGSLSLMRVVLVD